MTEILILILSVAIGVAIAKFLKLDKFQSKLLLSFSGAFFLGITVMEILPSVYHHSSSAKWAGIFVLIGVLIQIGLESVSKGIEHGHIHLHKNTSFPSGIFLGLFLHALIEGVPVAGEYEHHFLWAIFVHNIPVSLILFSAVSSIVDSPIKQYGIMLLFALASPIGFLFGKYTPISNYTVEISAIVSGIFLHISTVILFETSEGHHFNVKKFLVLIVGFVLAYFTISGGHSH